MSKRLRKEGKIPVALYKGGEEPYHGAMGYRQFFQAASKSLSSQVFTVKSDGSFGTKKALVKEIQRHPVKGDVLHVDFQILEDGVPAKVRVPVKTKGIAPGVKLDGGVFTTQCREVTLLSPPEKIPNELEVDVSHLRMGQRITTGDIELPEGVVLSSTPEETVANVVTSRAVKLAAEEDAAAAEAAAEGVAEGAAPKAKEGAEKPKEK